MLKKVEDRKMGGLLLADPYKDIWVCEITCSNNDTHYLFNKEYRGKPTIETVSDDVLNELNSECEKEIRECFKYNEFSVWLSLENQQNYKMLYDYFAKNSAKLPLKVKLYDENGIGEYEEFASFADYEVFYFSTIEHINQTLSKYWQIKDSIDWSVYEI